MTLILKWHIDLGHVCRMLWVPTKNCVVEKRRRLSSQAYILFQAFHITTANKESWPSASRQKDIKQDVDISDLPALTHSDNDEVLIGDLCLSLLHSSVLKPSPLQPRTTQPNAPSSPSLSLPVHSLYIHYFYFIQLVYLSYYSFSNLSVILGFMCYLV